MKQSFARYLAKRAEPLRWPLHYAGLEDVDTVVVIPCLGESDTLPRTLRSLAACRHERRQNTLVICVVNNRTPEFCCSKDIVDNRQLLGELEGVLEDRPTRFETSIHQSLRMAYVDASSPGSELPKKDGVGLARKIGLDWGLRVLADSDAPVRLLCSLDADTTVEPNYLDALRIAFAHETAWAGVVHFEHPLPDGCDQRKAIIEYECFLRSHVHGLRAAGSPYAFHTVGSTMVCTPEAYVAVSGMNRKQAGEDFYFLQQLAKTGEMQIIAATTVHPSPRASHRVPFGTGTRVKKSIEHAHDRITFHAPETYRSVRRCIQIADQHPKNAETFLEKAQAFGSALPTFLRNQEFVTAWERILRGALTEQQRTRQFHTWFDAFRTLKLIHYVRDYRYPDVDLPTAARAWPSDEDLDCGNPERVLTWLRDQDRNAANEPLGLRRGPNVVLRPLDP